MSEEMTNKQAMEILEAARKTMYLPKSGKYISDMGYALEKGIAALEAEPCDEAISRQAALRQAINAHKMAQENGFDFEDICEEYLNVLPPVTPKQRTGHWIFVDKAHEHAHCSECDYGNVDLFDGRPHNYCPSCGCHMVEPQEREEA